jgi:hypothetical protein
LNAVAVVRAVVRQTVQLLSVEENRGKPDRPDAQLLQIRELRLHARDGSTLKSAELCIERLMARLLLRIVEAVHHQEIDENVAPILG